MADFERFYLDTNVLIAIAELIPKASARQIEMMDKIASGLILVVSSEIALSECLVKPMADNDNDLVELYKKMLGGDSEITILPISTDVLIEAARIRSIYKIKLPDAIHMATAGIFKCDKFITNDRKLVSVMPENSIVWDTL